jgi:hypothetical protein
MGDKMMCSMDFFVNILHKLLFWLLGIYILAARVKVIIPTMKGIIKTVYLYDNMQMSALLTINSTAQACIQNSSTII